MNKFFLWVGLACVAPAHTVHSAPAGLSVNLAPIEQGQCITVDWRLAHVALPVSVCQMPTDAQTPDRPPAPDLAALQTHVLAMRERWVDLELAQAVWQTQAHLDTTATRSLHPQWRVFIQSGVWGCVPSVVSPEASAPNLRYRDPCNQQGYDAQG
jgi:hypothetical protein